MPTACPATATCRRSSRWVRCDLGNAKQAWCLCNQFARPSKSSSNMQVRICNDIDEHHNGLPGSRNSAGFSIANVKYWLAERALIVEAIDAAPVQATDTWAESHFHTMQLKRS